ncbi:CCHC-type Zinc finger, nucleic acid binding protein a [Plakobranchus ocellatus]|uniref:CCHC-type Zinc finger, nucleic acid binding protein a n=1 Tax=Plakobranchus ocellatus TaxID=259542 RepID=A0AAV4BNZ5_9GAST|nr:CCHC-type Zinc finger, nucleic acid binding protein a [Plakobranchus ocellatus]
MTQASAGGCRYHRLQTARLVKVPKSVKGIFIGYDRRIPAYLIYFSETLKVRKIRCVKFHNVKADSKKPDSVEIPYKDYVDDKDKPSQTQQKTTLTVTVEENKTTQESQNQSSQGVIESLGKRNRTGPNFLDDFIMNDHADSDSDRNDLLNSPLLHYCYNSYSKYLLAITIPYHVMRLVNGKRLCMPKYVL